MPIKAVVSEEEYLRTTFPGVDPEYRDGELMERGVPNYFHGVLQGDLYSFFKQHRQRNLFPAVETRLRVRPGRVMIPDVVVFWPNDPNTEFPETLPLIAIEILSKDDRLAEVRDKLQEYLNWGVPHVWLIDPTKNRLYVYRDGLREVQSFSIPEVSLELAHSDIFGRVTPPGSPAS
jgi:Uma2 family endonuclease